MSNWTTRVVNMDLETGEVLEAKDVHKYRLIKNEKIYQKINATHTERIIIRHWRKSEQQRLW